MYCLVCFTNYLLTHNELKDLVLLGAAKGMYKRSPLPSHASQGNLCCFKYCQTPLSNQINPQAFDVRVSDALRRNRASASTEQPSSFSYAEPAIPLLDGRPDPDSSSTPTGFRPQRGEQK